MYPFWEHQSIDGSKMHTILHRQCIDDTKLSTFLRLIGINVRFCEQSVPVNKLTVYFVFLPQRHKEAQRFHKELLRVSSLCFFVPLR
jgi:hypothetical protein